MNIFKKIKKNLAIILLLSMSIGPVANTNIFGLGSISSFFSNTKNGKNLTCKKNNQFGKSVFSKPSLLIGGILGGILSISIITIAIIFRKNIASFLNKPDNKPEEIKKPEYNNIQTKPTNKQNINNDNNKIEEKPVSNNTENKNPSTNHKKTCVIFYDDEELYTTSLVEELEKDPNIKEKFQSYNVIKCFKNESIDPIKEKDIDLLLCVMFKPTCRIPISRKNDLNILTKKAKSTLLVISEADYEKFPSSVEGEDLGLTNNKKYKLYNFLLNNASLVKNKHNEDVLKKFSDNI